MFEERTFNALLEDVLNNAPEGVDTREGSIFYDAVSGTLLKIARLYADLDIIVNLVYIDTTAGEYLDRKASENAITRMSATAAKYRFTYSGVEPEAGERFYVNGIYFTLKSDGDNKFYLEADEPGTVANGIYEGTAVIPVNNLIYLESATIGELIEPGTNEETDDELRERLREKIAGPAENGNRQHYRTWCEEIDGVGRARIIPLWNGPNTVKGIIIDPNGKPATETVVKRVQEYIDPDDDNDGEGDGLGEGVANIGAHFTAVAPDVCEVSISFDVQLATGAAVEDVEADVLRAVETYIQNLTLNTADDEDIVIRIATIGAQINALASVVDYSNLKINGASANVTPTATSVAVVQEVNANVL